MSMENLLRAWQWLCVTLSAAALTFISTLQGGPLVLVALIPDRAKNEAASIYGIVVVGALLTLASVVGTQITLARKSLPRRERFPELFKFTVKKGRPFSVSTPLIMWLGVSVFPAWVLGRCVDELRQHCSAACYRLGEVAKIGPGDLAVEYYGLAQTAALGFVVLAAIIAWVRFNAIMLPPGRGNPNGWINTFLSKVGRIVGRNGSD